MIDLDTLESAIAEATKGDWSTTASSDEYWLREVRRDGDSVAFCGDSDAEQAHADVRAIIALHNAAPELLRLARRGLRAEREVCGTCRWWDGDMCLSVDGLGIGRACADTDYCCAWLAKEGTP